MRDKIDVLLIKLCDNCDDFLEFTLPWIGFQLIKACRWLTGRRMISIQVKQRDYKVDSRTLYTYVKLAVHKAAQAHPDSFPYAKPVSSYRIAKWERRVAANNAGGE